MKPTLVFLAALLWSMSVAAQSSEAPAEINVLTYTNSNYHHHDGFQQWIYSPTESRTGGGYLRIHDIAHFHRYGGGYHSNFWANHSFAVGEDPYEYYHEYRNATAWFGPLPADAVWASYSTNYWWWPWMANAETSAYPDGGTHTEYWWSPPESRKALYAEDVPNWTLIFHWGEPHQGYFEKWTNGTTVDTTLELFTGGVTNSANDVTMQLNVWAYDNLRGRWLTGNEFTVTVGGLPGAGNPFVPFGGGTALALTPDTSDNVYFLAQDNQHAQITFSFHPTNALPTNLPPGAVEDVSFYAWPARHHLLVGVDKNRDGNIELDGTNDLTSAAAPYVFWANNDRDTFHEINSVILGNYFEFDDVEDGPTDFSYTDIHNERDVEDFSLLAVRVPDFVRTNEGWTVSVQSAGSIKLFLSPVSDFSYLSDAATTALLINNPSLRVPAPSQLSEDMYEPLRNGAYFLFEFGEACTGPVTVEIRKDGNLVGRGKAHLSIKDIKTMYDRFTAGDQDGTTVTTTFEPYTSPQTIAQADIETLQFYGHTNYVLLVHGWNMRIWAKERFAETMFKRLWWQGYRGRCGLFRWQTYTTDHPGGWSLVNYDASEFNSWKSAQALSSLLSGLNASLPGNVRVLAHSMGNVVTSEALRLLGTNQSVHTYLAMQGALPAHCYDPVELHSNPDSGTATPDRYSQYWTSGAGPYIQNKAGGQYVNMPNRLDFALNKWLWNEQLKPDGSRGYYYSSSYPASGFYKLATGFPTRYLAFPQDTYEIFAFGVQPRCFAIGAAPGLGGSFDTGMEINLKDEFGFTDVHSYHSKQFRSAIVLQWGLYQRMMGALGLPSN